jgi:hypothetical protein
MDENNNDSAIPKYTFKVTDELVWTLVVAAITPLLTALSQFDPDKITDWRVWGVGIIAAMIRAGVAALLAAIGPGGFRL